MTPLPAVERAALETIRKMVEAQADDEGLWFAAKTAPEAYLQQELRKLHGLIEHLVNKEAGSPALSSEPLQKPVAWRWKREDGGWAFTYSISMKAMHEARGVNLEPLYSHPVGAEQTAKEAAYRERLEIAIEALRQVSEYSHHTGAERALRQVQSIADSAYKLIEAEPFKSQHISEGKMPGWQKIETAPKDGTEILVWSSGSGYWPRMAVWRDSYWALDSANLGIPTHWMPLPAAPKK